MKTLQTLRSLFRKRETREDLRVSLRQYLEQTLTEARHPSKPLSAETFSERLELLLQSEDANIAHVALQWSIETLTSGKQKLPTSLVQPLKSMIRPKQGSWLRMPLLEWLDNAPASEHKFILGWLADLDYDTQERQEVIQGLLGRYLQTKSTPKPVLATLISLDAVASEVCDLALQYFPLKNPDENFRIIDLLGKTGRYRVIKPLIQYAEEYPTYFRAVMKALSKLQFDEVNQFYLNCLKNTRKHSPIVLIEAIKQVRKRKIRKAIPHLDALFPMEDSQTSLVNRTINGEIALTMATFGAYTWAREKLLPEMMLGGTHLKYLKAIDMLHLEDAVPLLKALMLMPETPELQVIQQQAYQICERLLMSPESAPLKLPTQSHSRSDLQEVASRSDFLAF